MRGGRELQPSASSGNDSVEDHVLQRSGTVDLGSSISDDPARASLLATAADPGGPAPDDSGRIRSERR
ncbi:unnamed protein product [Urochloa humidicola]